MEWEKPQLVDLSMVKYKPACSDGNFVDGGVCGPFGSAADGKCITGSSAYSR